MTKRIVITCLLLLSVAGLKAQTYCYHCYKSCVETKSGYKYSLEDYYTTFTFKGDCLHTDNTYPLSAASRSNRLWKKSSMENGGVLIYSEYEKNIFGNWKQIDYTNFDHFYEVSGNRNTITYIKTSNNSPFEAYYYERCPDRNCR